MYFRFWHGASIHYQTELPQISWAKVTLDKAYEVRFSASVYTNQTL